MITVALTATIDAPGERVWRALVDAAERPAWDDRILGEVHLPETSARLLRLPRPVPPGFASGAPRRTRWRFRLAGVPLVMIDEVLRIDGHERLLGRISIGSLRFDHTTTIHHENDRSGRRVRVGMKLVAANSVAVIGEVVPRLEVQRILIEYADTTLRRLRKHCESDGLASCAPVAREGRRQAGRGPASARLLPGP